MEERIILEGHKNRDCFVVGKIVFDDIVTENQFKGKNRFNPRPIGECIIEVYSNEGPIPHFHIFNKDRSFETCIRIYENFYFSHGGKYTSRFNSKQCAQLNQYLKQSYQGIKDIGVSVWQAIMINWDSSTQYNYPNKTTVQPHYDTMNNFKDI